jgi:hypothetical protein
VLAAWLIVPAAALGARAIYTPPACQTLTFHSEPGLNPQRVCMNVGVTTHRTGQGTFLFLTPDNAGVGIFRDTGRLVWWQGRPPGTTEEHNATVVNLWGRRYLAVWAGRSSIIGTNHTSINSGTVLLYNQRYEQVGEITAASPFYPNRVDMHEFRVTPQGDALIGIYEPVQTTVNGHAETVVQYIVQKLSLVHDSNGIHTGKVLFEWRSLQHVPVSDSYDPDPGAGGAWDYFHGNALSQDSDGNVILSARNTWGIYKISVKTGRIMWQVGGKGASTLAPAWCYQHDVTALGHHEYSLFDDGAVGPGCTPGHSWHPSRGLIFRVDAAKRPARVRLVKSYAHHPSIHAEYLGSMQRLSNGSVLIDWGNVAQITQYSADGRVDMDLTLSNDSYRGFRYPWAGNPISPPSVAAQLRSSGTDVWASWNGANQVVAWRVLGGATADSLAPAGPPSPGQGFETHISLGQRYSDVAVEALSSSGQVLARSRTVSTVPLGTHHKRPARSALLAAVRWELGG